jgi:hypothetical protein
MLPALILLATAGLALTLLGLIGRRVGEHPHCRRCGRNLFGVESAACPECGRDVTPPAATVIGHRQRRPRLAWLGGTLLVAPIAVLLATTAIDWQSLKPAAWLIAELDGDQTFIAAADSLRTKLEARQLDDAAVERAADKLLARQADADKPWHLAAGQFIEAAHDAGQLGDERWQAYLRHIFGRDAVELQVRPVIRQGDPLPIRLARTNIPIGNQLRGGDLRFGFAADAGIPDLRNDATLRSNFHGGSRTNNRPKIPGMRTAQWPIGTKLFTLEVRHELHPSPGGSGIPAPDSLPLAVNAYRHSFEVEVLPADVPQPLLDARAAFAPPPGAVEPASKAAYDEPARTDQLELSIRILPELWPRLSDHVAHVLAADRSIPLKSGGWMTEPEWVTLDCTGPAGAALPGSTVTILLLPDHDEALERVEATPIYDGPVRVEDVPVRHQAIYEPPG